MIISRTWHIRRFYAQDTGCDYTSGLIPRRLITFAPPFVFSNLLQTAYNIVDIMVVGRMIGSVGMSAVSIGAKDRNAIPRILGRMTTVLLGLSLLTAIFGPSLCDSPSMALCNGMGFPRLTFFIGLLGGFVMRIGLCWLLGSVLRRGIKGYWLGSAFAGYAYLIAMFPYYLSGHWKKRAPPVESAVLSDIKPSCSYNQTQHIQRSHDPQFVTAFSITKLNQPFFHIAIFSAQNAPKRLTNICLCGIFVLGISTKKIKEVTRHE